MANVFLPNSNSFITVGTLGNILNSKIKIELDNVTWLSKAGAIVAQAASSNAELYFWASSSSGSMFLELGGSSNNIGQFDAVFDIANLGNIDNESIVFEVETNGTYRVFRDGNQVNTGSVSRAGTERVDGQPFRIGARGNSSSQVFQGSAFIKDGDKVGNVRVFVDDVLTRDIRMPANDAGDIVENVSSTTGTLYGADADGDTQDANFEVISSGAPVTTKRITFDIPSLLRNVSDLQYTIIQLPIATGTVHDSGTLPAPIVGTTREFNLDTVTEITNGMTLALICTDATGVAADGDVGMIGTAQAIVATS